MVNARFKMLGLVAISATLLFGASAATAADGEAAAEPEGWAYKISHELMSPFCPGRTLSACTSPQADSLRMWLIVQEASGRTREEVEAELFERYGDVLRSAPRAEGFGLTAYVFPVLAFLAGGVFIAIFLSRQTRAAATNQPSPQPPDPELERIIDQELAG
jgi:cytochrome c-type biogenesis protein CcmH/NrfF